VGGVRLGAGLRRPWAVGWASHEVGSWPCPLGRWDGGHAAGATGVPVADGEGSMECAADADPDDRRNGRGGDRRQRVYLAAVCPVVAFPASSSVDGLSSCPSPKCHPGSKRIYFYSYSVRISCFRERKSVVFSLMRVMRIPRAGRAELTGTLFPQDVTGFFEN